MKTTRGQKIPAIHSLACLGVGSARAMACSVISCGDRVMCRLAGASRIRLEDCLRGGGRWQKPEGVGGADYDVRKARGGL